MGRISFIIMSLIAVLFVVGLCIGDYPLSLAQIIKTISGHGTEPGRLMLFDIRMVRGLLAIICGAGLAMSGAALQGLVRNSLAEPAILGLSSGAALGAVLAYYLGGGFGVVTAVAAIVGSAITAFAVLIVSLRSNSANALVLSGAAISSLAGAAIVLTLNLLPNPFALADVTFWLMGSFADRSWQHVYIAAPCVIAGIALIFSCRHQLVEMGFGEEVAISRGVNINLLRLKIVTASALIVGGSVAVAGIIGFIGLVAPHIVRPFCGNHPAKIIIPSALLGALMLLASDVLVRVMPSVGGEIKIGVITALMGAPVFLAIILQGRKC